MLDNAQNLTILQYSQNGPSQTMSRAFRNKSHLGYWFSHASRGIAWEVPEISVWLAGCVLVTGCLVGEETIAEK